MLYSVLEFSPKLCGFDVPLPRVWTDPRWGAQVLSSTPAPPLAPVSCQGAVPRPQGAHSRRDAVAQAVPLVTF